MDKKEVAYNTAKILLDTKSVLVNTKEPFTYTSGNVGPVYVDMRRMISFPKERSILMDYAADMLRPLNMDYVAGGETAGIPYAAFLAERLEVPMLYIRKKPKGHGRMAQIEGHMEEKKNVILIEDLMNVGSSQQVFVKALREANAIIENTFVVFSYDIYPKTKENLKDININLHALTNWWAILEVVKAENYFDSETITSLEEFLNEPESWADKRQAGA